MPDDSDQASDIETLQRDIAINKARNDSKKPRIVSLHCFNCNAPSMSQSRFCSPECRDDYEFEQHLRTINGGL